MITDKILEWRVGRWERGITVGSKTSADDRYYLIVEHQRIKAEVKKLVEALSGGRHMRDLIFRMWNDQAFDRWYYKSDHERYEEKKKTMRRRIEQLRSMRLSMGIPAMFHYGQTVGADRNSNYVSYHDLDAFKAAVPGLHEIGYMMTPLRANRLVDRVMTRKGHFGRWCYSIKERDETKEEPVPVRFYFEDPMDVIEFRMRYDSEYEKIDG